ncbi:MAG: Gfo/Idh/MocA family oxidoreductase [Muribaculaceae bacterium]|nr:Gfo/Idh/MocA family oxidoreductase [Muribaculaceae bacterium]
MKVLIVGLGSIARKHIAALYKIIPEVTIYALRSSVSSKEMENIISIYDTKELPDNIDFAIISNPTSLHGQTIEKLLDLKIPLFIEKPVFDKLEYDTLIERINQAHIPTYVACNLRFLDCIRYLHDYLIENPGRRINEVNVYCGSFLPDWRPGVDFRECYSAIPELGGGVNIDLIHDIDYTYWIFGKPEKSFGFCRNVSSLNIRAFDYAHFSFLYPTFTASITLNYYRRDYRRMIEILFDDVTWTADLSKNIIVDQDNNIVFEGTDKPIDTYTAQLEYFIKSIKDHSKIENDVNTAYEVLKICLDYERLS